MTPTAKYIAEENCLQEESQMEKPRKPNPYTDSIDAISLQRYKSEVAEYDKRMAEYTRHLATLRKIPCDASCKGLWADGQKLVVGKDYGVRDYPIRAMLPTDPKFIAFPIVPVKSEDELWEEAFLMLRKRGYNPAEVELILIELKKSYSLTKR